MRKSFPRFVSMFLVCMLLITLVPFSARNANADDLTTLTLEVTYGQSEARAMLDYINKFRAGNDVDGQPAAYLASDNTTLVDLTGQLDPLVYDYYLESIAMQRAAEVALSFSHTRPDGTRCFSAGSFSGENIAAGYSTAYNTFVQWREDDDDYSGQGHRRNMLGSFSAIGIGHVVLNGYHYWAQAFGSTSGSGATEAADGSYTVEIFVASDRFVSQSLSSPSPDALDLIVGESKDLPSVSLSFMLVDAWPPLTTQTAVSAVWTSENEQVARVEGNQVVGTGSGTTNLTTTVNGTSFSVPVTVVPPAVVQASIDPATVTVPSGTAPDPRPETATIFWTNGQTTTEPISWDRAIVKEDYTKRNGGTTVFTGTAAGVAVTYTLKVTPAEILSVSALPDLEIFTTTKITSVLPSAVPAVWSDGDPASDAPIQWADVPDFYPNAGTYILAGRVGDRFDITQTFFVKEPMVTDVAWKTRPSCTTFYYGSVFRTDGILTVSYDDGFSRDVPVSTEMITGFDGATPGTQTLTVTYKEGSVEKQLFYDVVVDSQTSIETAAVEELGSFAYTGLAQTPVPALTVQKDGTSVSLVKDQDFTLTYADNVNVGTATVTITGMGDYAGSMEKTFRITAVKLASATLKKTSLVYNGNAQKTTATVKATVNGTTKTLKANEDYSLSFKNNTNVGTATVTIKGKGNYTGSIKKTFKITAVKLASATLKKTSFVYNGKARTTTATVTATVNGSSKTLTADTDYTLSFKNNKNAGTATVTITGTGNYTGTLTKTFTITPVKLSSATLKTTSYVYNGKARKPAVTVKAKVNNKTKTLKKGTDYTVSYKNNINAGTATVTVTGKGNFKGTIKKSFKITKVSISSASIRYSSGSGKKPTVTVWAYINDQEKTLTAKTDYKVSYKENTSGTTKITITGIGNYSGSIVFPDVPL